MIDTHEVHPARAAKTALAKDDETLDRTGWRPSEAQMAAYKSREVQLCVATIQNVKDLRQDHTLFSYKTWEAARALVVVEEQATELKVA